MDDLVTLRNDRFVIPMRDSDPAANDGVIQDRSSSGMTIFVEPMAVVEFNNRLRRIGMEESREVERILRQLTDLVRENRYALTDDVAVVGDLDAIHAVARFGVLTDGAVAGRLDTAELNLLEARHPLLVLKSRKSADGKPAFVVVPMTVALGDSATTIIVTGPNTGGKTVALKTVGLLVLMSQAGWPVPAFHMTKIGVFQNVFADIGDEQSIESSLSTFSSHLGRINDALATADDHSLVLLDELGAGTDPKEGAALGEAIVGELTDRGARLVVTTHHTALKTLAQHDTRIENAAVLFDPKTLSPTYQFRMGLPGASYAIDIARRLGLPDSVTRRADSLVDQQEKDLSHLLLELDERLEAVRQSQEDTEKRQHAAEALEDLFRARMAKLEQLESKRKSEALAEAEEIVKSTRHEMERLVREIRETQAERQRVKESHHAIDERLQNIKKQQAEIKPAKPPKEPSPLAVGDRVWIEAFNREGEVLSIDERRDQVKVQLGDFLYTIDRTAAERVASTDATDSTGGKPRKIVSGGYINLSSAVGPEISLRGLSAEDALEMLDRYLDEARLAGWHEVRIVHGKGEGILRRAVGEFLSKDKRVVSKRLGQWNEGADGVTIAALRPEDE
jgi:DNA mismatch repair protein MutS2